MTLADQTPSITLFDMPLEKALDAIEMLSNVTKTERDNLTVYSGLHPTLGWAHIVLPPIGDPIVLPLFIDPPGKGNPKIEALAGKIGDSESNKSPVADREP